MKPYCLKVVLGLSLLLNASVIGAVGFQMWRTGQVSSWIHGEDTHTAAEYLGLSEAQQRLWREKEIKFKKELTAAWMEIRDHREKMIRELFAPKPDTRIIEKERTAIATLQENQQRQVIEQLMSERDMLDDRQRQALAALLITQNPVGSMEEMLTKHLHRD
jgi:hypothetical protein